MSDDGCRICGVILESQHWPHSSLMAWPKPLLPGDIPGRSEVCDKCNEIHGPFPDKPYTPSWATTSGGRRFHGVTDGQEKV